MHLMDSGRLWLALALGVSLAAPLAAAPPARSLLRVETRFQGAPGKEQYPEADVLFLEDDISFEVRPDGSTVYTEHDAIKILSEDGAEGYGQLARLYRQGLEAVEIEEARTIRPDGRVLDVAGPALTDQPVFPGSRLYGEYRRLLVRFPEATPGAVVEFRVRTTRQPRPGGQWWAASYVQNPDPMLSSTFEARLPAGLEPHWAAPGLTPSQPAVSREGDTQVLRWSAANVPALAVEPSMPAMETLLHRVELTSFRDWESVGAWLWPRWQEAVADHPRVGILASGLVPGGGSVRDRARPVLEWVATHRVVQEALAGWEPHPAPALLEAPEGSPLSPLDSAVLIAAMLAHAGIEARPVLASPIELADLRRDLPDPETVSRILLALPGPDGSRRWIDPASPLEVLDHPPAGAQQVGAVLLGPGGPELISTDSSPADENRREIEVDVRVEADGQAELTMTLTMTGLAGALWQGLSRDLAGVRAEERQNLLDTVFERFAMGFAANGKVYSYYVPPEAHPDRPYQLSTTVMFPELAAPEPKATGLAMPLPVYGGDRLAAFAAEAGGREYPVRFDYPFRDDLRVHVRLPDGSKITSLPAPVSVENGQGTFFSTSRQGESEVWYYSRLVVRQPWISPGDYRGLLQLAQAEASALQAPLVFTPPPKGAAPEEAQRP